MYSGTMIEDLIASVARAERLAQAGQCGRELAPTTDELTALCAQFTTDSELLAGVA